MKRIRTAFIGPVLAGLMILTGSLSASADGTLDLSAYKGKVVYIDFWASWCGPCKASFPWMIEMENKYGDKGLKIVAINLDKDKALADSFMEQFPEAKMELVYDPSGSLAERFEISAMPTSFTLDKEGNIYARHEGFFQKQSAKVEEEIKELLKD